MSFQATDGVLRRRQQDIGVIARALTTGPDALEEQQITLFKYQQPINWKRAQARTDFFRHMDKSLRYPSSGSCAENYSCLTT